jgi:hypothetical protein
MSMWLVFLLDLISLIKVANHKNQRLKTLQVRLFFIMLNNHIVTTRFSNFKEKMCMQTKLAFIFTHLFHLAVVFSQIPSVTLKFEGENQVYSASNLRETYHQINKMRKYNKSWAIIIQGNTTYSATDYRWTFPLDSSWYSYPSGEKNTATLTIMGSSNQYEKMPVMDGENIALGLWRFSGCERLIIKNIHFKRFNIIGLQFNNCKNCKIIRCMFSEVKDTRGQAAISLYQSHHCLVDSCVFDDLVGPRDRQALHAVYLNCNSNNNLIQNNVVKYCSGSAFKVRNNCNENEFLYNVIDKCSGLSFFESNVDDPAEIEPHGNRVDWNICLSPGDSAVAYKNGAYIRKFRSTDREMYTPLSKGYPYEMYYKSSPLYTTFAYSNIFFTLNAKSFYLKVENPIISDQPARFEFSQPLYESYAEFQENIPAKIIPIYFSESKAYRLGFEVTFDSDTPQKILTPFDLKTFEGDIIRTYYLEKWIVKTESGNKTYIIRGAGQNIGLFLSGPSEGIRFELRAKDQKLATGQKDAGNQLTMNFVLEKDKEYQVNIFSPDSIPFKFIAKPLLDVPR